MTTRVALVSCVKEKSDVAAPARDLYLSQLFRGLRKYAEKHADTWYILSALHGVVRPDTVVKPYERTLNKMSRQERLAWAEAVMRQLLAILPADAEIILLAGQRYREDIEVLLRKQGFAVSIPLEGLGIGKQLQFLKAMPMTEAASDPLERFYSLLARLATAPGQGRALRDLPAGASMPKRGVYFFCEPGEFRTREPSVGRVVRVGTHAVSAGSKATLRNRLKQHLGTRAGGGNHRGSIFRLHVGAALLERESILSESWGVGSSAPAAVRESEAVRTAEIAWEKRVSDYIGGMSVFWIDVPDEASRESERSLVEQNAIALLSNKFAPVDKPSSNWLGRFSPRREIRDSGLWNLYYVASDWNAGFLDRMEWFVKLTCR